MIEQFYFTQLKDTTNQSRSEPGSNINEEVLYMPQSSGTRTSPSEVV